MVGGRNAFVFCPLSVLGPAKSPGLGGSCALLALPSRLHVSIFTRSLIVFSGERLDSIRIRLMQFFFVVVCS